MSITPEVGSSKRSTKLTNFQLDLAIKGEKKISNKIEDVTTNITEIKMII